MVYTQQLFSTVKDTVQLSPDWTPFPPTLTWMAAKMPHPSRIFWVLSIATVVIKSTYQTPKEPFSQPLSMLLRCIKVIHIVIFLWKNHRALSSRGKTCEYRIEWHSHLSPATDSQKMLYILYNYKWLLLQMGKKKFGI